MVSDIVRFEGTHPIKKKLVATSENLGLNLSVPQYLPPEVVGLD